MRATVTRHLATPRAGTFPVDDPATGRVNTEVPDGTAANANAAADANAAAATGALAAWSATSPRDRAETLRPAARPRR
jgi:succinate-semialdehyde dehydrogenase/glutarate-semialdehyde dehydrogenase